MNMLFPVLRRYLGLAKPRIALMVMFTTVWGFLLAGGNRGSLAVLSLTLLGVGAATGGSAVLNNYLERDFDARMARTRGRPLPSGLIEPGRALIFGVSLVLFGVFFLVWAANLLTAFLVLMAAFLCVLVYTPLKRVTWLNTTFGAIPGAIPPLAGWAAASGQLGTGAWALFAILFAWQHPHFFAIPWMYRDDYRAAGFKMLPAIETNGVRTIRLTFAFTLILLGASLAPTLIGMTGWLYSFGTVLIGALMLQAAMNFARECTSDNARRLLRRLDCLSPGPAWLHRPGRLLSSAELI